MTLAGAARLFSAPPLVQQAAERAIRGGRTQYTQAPGLPELRERISAWYASRFGVNVPARRIVVTAGASAALQLACLALIESGDEILMPDPSYPCNRHFVSAAEGKPVLIPSSAAERFQLSAAKVEAAWGERTRGVMLASPSNPRKRPCSSSSRGPRKRKVQSPARRTRAAAPPPSTCRVGSGRPPETTQAPYTPAALRAGARSTRSLRGWPMACHWRSSSSSAEAVRGRLRSHSLSAIAT